MNDKEHGKLSELTRQLSSMTFVLNYYCKNFSEEIKEISKLVEFTEILDKKTLELYDLL
jgi:hypothetical protein